MIRMRAFLEPGIILAVLGSAACASNPEPEDVCATSPPDVSAWEAHDEGEFTVRLPAEYEGVPVQGIDSQVGRWEAPGKRLAYDFGVYANPLEPNELNAFPGLVVCQESDGAGAPRILLHSPPDGGYAVSAHWPDLRSRGPLGTESLTLEGVVEHPEDRGELLAILRSVRIQSIEAEVPPAPAPPATSTGAGDSALPSAAPAPPLTPDGWGPIRIGMTRAELVAAAGEDANPGAVGGPEPEACDQFRPEEAPAGMLVMVERDRVTRITMSRERSVRTERGFGVGDPAAAIEEAYGSNAAVTPHKYSPAPARYITVWTAAPPAPDARGLVYEIGTDGRVMHVHAGGPSIQYVEGCL